MRQRKATVVILIAILFAFAAVVINSMPSGTSSGATHTMPDGNTTQGDEMP